MPTSIGRRLSRTFFARDSPLVASDLLGRIVITGVGPDRVAARLTEVEAYAGDTDPASHAFRGPTPRNAVMFGPPGHLYLYFIYGMYWCANIVVGKPGIASAVLLRAGEIVEGLELAQMRSSGRLRPNELAAGPARLASCLGLGAVGRTTAINGSDLCTPDSTMTFHAGTSVPPDQVRAGPRVGVSTAHEVPWRFWIDGDPTVSKYRRHVPKPRTEHK